MNAKKAEEPQSMLEKLVEKSRVNRKRVQEEDMEAFWESFNDAADKAAKNGKCFCKVHFETSYPDFVADEVKKEKFGVDFKNGYIIDKDDFGQTIFTISWPH